MKIQRFFAKDMRTALAEVKDVLGADAVIMSNTKVNGGVELVAAIDQDDAPTPRRESTMAKAQPRADRQLADDNVSLSSVARQSPQPVRPQPQLSGDWRQQDAQSRSDSLPDWSRNLFNARQQPKVEEPAPQAIPQARSRQQQMDDMVNEIQSLRQLLEHQVSGLRHDAQARQQPVKTMLSDRLVEMGLARELAAELVSPMPEALGAADGWKWLMVQLKKRLVPAQDPILNRGGVVALMGPTGVGKTTTVAKLASHYAMHHGVDQVALVTTDTYRIGAHEQLATYGRILGCPVRQARDAEELEEVLYQLRNRSLVLIDTAGMGQRDLRLNQQLDTLMQSGRVPIQRYLVLAATAQTQVLGDAHRRFSQIPLDGCILTKLDETLSLGGCLSLAVQNALPIGYLTDGQRVPEDLQVAEPQALVERAVALLAEAMAA
ncbi:flagellar biosynthesis protein FlhF [Gallaecimonas sp. GXIMD4217]|uniref:flagellar biosynthesis protein FlhF n=1 Tax=Gallaecimonas sp. GXIMD4217 TaxID=3131927 RepID=UPI00311AE653